MADAMREALEHIIDGAGFECERFTSGIGSCFRQGMKPDAQFWSDRCCPACIAHNALCGNWMRNDAEKPEEKPLKSTAYNRAKGMEMPTPD